MSIIVENIENPECMFLIEIADILNIKELQLKYYETIFTIKIDNILVGVINYVLIPSMRKDRLHIRNIHYKNQDNLEIISKAL